MSVRVSTGGCDTQGDGTGTWETYGDRIHTDPNMREARHTLQTHQWNGLGATLGQRPAEGDIKMRAFLWGGAASVQT